MPNSKKPDFSRAYSKANEILVKSSAIQTFPFSPKDLVKEQTQIVCRSFKKARKYGVDIAAFGSESAIIMNFQGKKIIFYDETKPDTHNCFSMVYQSFLILDLAMNVHMKYLVRVFKNMEQSQSVHMVV